MIDIDFIKSKIIHQDDRKKIVGGDFISEEIVELLKQGDSKAIDECFAPTNGELYIVEYKCCDCEQIIKGEMGKTKLLEYLKNGQNTRCKVCDRLHKQEQKEEKEKKKREMQEEKERQKLEKKKIKEQKQTLEKQKERLEQKEENIKPKTEKQEIKDNTTVYMAKFLRGCRLSSKYSLGETIEAVIHPEKPIDNDVVAKRINSMENGTFLQTPYWQSISAYEKKKAGYKCELCGKDAKEAKLQTIRKVRDGYYHLQNALDNNYIVICSECGKKYNHDVYSILEELERKKNG